MANFPKMKLTNAGLELLTNVQAGADKLIFTKTVLGDGELSTSAEALTTLINPIIECEIVEEKNIGEGTFQIASFFSNTDVTESFVWREIGVFAKGNNGNEILYCYSNSGNSGDIIPVGADERVEKYIYLSLTIGNAENVTAEINSSDTFILASDKGASGGVAPLNADKKIDAVYLPELDYVTTHISDTTKHITATERSDWNSKAPGGHGLGETATLTDKYKSFMSFLKYGCGFYQVWSDTDAPSDETSWLSMFQLSRNTTEGLETGVQIAVDEFLPNNIHIWLRTVLKGTPKAWVEMLHTGNIENYATKIITGTYTGNGATTRFIDLGVTPKAIFVINSNGKFERSADGYATGSEMYSAYAHTGFSTPALEIVNGGINVKYSYTSNTGEPRCYTNKNKDIYGYIAFL